MQPPFFIFLSYKPDLHSCGKYFRNSKIVLVITCGNVRNNKIEHESTYGIIRKCKIVRLGTYGIVRNNKIEHVSTCGIYFCSFALVMGGSGEAIRR